MKLTKTLVLGLCITLCLVFCACNTKINSDNKENEEPINQEQTQENIEQINADKQLVHELCNEYYSAIYYESGKKNNEHILEYILPDTDKYQQMKEFDKAEEFANKFEQSFEYINHIQKKEIQKFVDIASAATKFDLSFVIIKDNKAKVDIEVMYVNPVIVDNLDNEQSITEYLVLKGTDYDTYAAQIDAMTPEEYEVERETFYKDYGQFLMQKAVQRVEDGVLSEKTVTENLVKIDGKWYIT